VKVNVVTTWAPGFPGAFRFVNSFMMFWPEWARLHLFYEGEAPFDCETTLEPDRIALHALDADDDRSRFLAEAPPDGYDYRQCARKFSHKVFAYTAPQVRDCDVLIWLDADTETVAPVSTEWLEAVGPGEGICSYLGRAHYEHTECGWLAFRMPAAAELLDGIRRMYVSRRILLLRGKTDCHAFDIARRAAGGECKNLSANAKGLHVWPQTRLAECLDHHKGPARKAAAYGG
jgi:hypothetical protein